VIATSGYDQVIRLWDASDGRNLGVVAGHENELWDVDFARDGRHLASASKDGTAKVWDLNNLRRSDQLTLATNEIFRGFVGTNDLVLTLSESRLFFSDGTNPQTGAELSEPLPNGRNNVTVSPARLYVGGTNGAVAIYDVLSGRKLSNMLCHTSAIWNVTATPDDRLLATTTYDPDGQTGVIRVWNLESGVLKQEFTDFLRGHQYFRQVALSQSGKLIAYPSENYSIKIWDLENNRLMCRLAGHKWFLNVLVFSPDAALLASGGWEGDIRLWNVREGQEAVPPLRGHGSGVFGLSFSNDGRTLISSGDDNNLRFWSAATGQQMLVLENLRSSPASNFVSPTGTRIVYWPPDGSVIVEPIPPLHALQAPR